MPTREKTLTKLAQVDAHALILALLDRGNKNTFYMNTALELIDLIPKNAKDDHGRFHRAGNYQIQHKAGHVLIVDETGNADRHFLLEYNVETGKAKLLWQSGQGNVWEPWREPVSGWQDTRTARDTILQVNVPFPTRKDALDLTDSFTPNAANSPLPIMSVLAGAIKSPLRRRR